MVVTSTTFHTISCDIQATARTQEEFDEYGAELGEHARVWKTYVKEADRFDAEQVDGWNRSLDVTLIFATFFAAICTAFVVESAKSLKEDPDEMSAHRLDHITGILLIMANVTNPSELNTTRILNPDPFSPRSIDICINALWTFSLITSVAVPPIAMLAKDWCHLFMTGRIGDPWSRTKRRQKRWRGVEKWRMEKVILFLPSLIHLAFLSFAVGLCLYIGDLYPSVAIPAAVVTLGSILVYMTSTLLPLWDRVCPYRGPMSGFVMSLWWRDTHIEHDDQYPEDIAVDALAWLIKSSKEERSTEIALQAIAGADPNDNARERLRYFGADKMILRRLITLDSHSRNSEQIFDLYTRAQSFFQHSVPGRMIQKEAPVSVDVVVSNPGGLVQKKPTQQPLKNSNRELQRKLRKLRDTINKEITAYATSDPVFQPRTHNIGALRIGSTASSYCLQSLQHGTQTQIEGQFDCAAELLESYRNREAHLNPEEIQYLMTGAAMLLSFLLVECDPTDRAQCAMPLVRIVNSAKGEQKQLELKYLGLPLAAYALSQYDYPGWTQPPPLAPILRAERAIEMISYYVSHPKKLDDVAPTMVNIGLLQLLLDSKGCKLEPADIATISEAFMDDAEAGQTRIYTFTANPYTSPYSRTLKGIAVMASDECSSHNKDTVAFACLKVLSHIRMDDSIADAAMGQVYAFVIECVLDLPSATPEAFGVKAALDIMKKFPSYPDWTPEFIRGLAKLLIKRKIVAKLKEKAELDLTARDQNLETKLFATGQACFLIDGTLNPTTTADQEAWRCLVPFIGGESSWDPLEDAIRRLKKERGTLAESYRTMWGSNNTRRHPYYEILLRNVEVGEDGPQSVSS